MGLPGDQDWKGDVDEATYKSGWNDCLAACQTNMATLYYEAHITIDPVEDWRRNEVEGYAHNSGFKLAKLLMDKGVPSQLDTFMTAHSKDLEDIKHRTQLLIRVLHGCGFKVRRYKIEDTVLDSRHDDLWCMVNSNAPSKPPITF